MTIEEKFDYLWILCSQRTKRQFLELIEKIEESKKKSEKDAKKQR